MAHSCRASVKPGELARKPTALLLCFGGLALVAQPVKAEEPPKQRRVLVMDIQHAGDVDADTAKTITDLVTGHLSKFDALYVISGTEIAEVAVLEGEKQRYGCTDNTCLAELANALGARYVVFGRASTLGEIMVVQLRLFDAGEARFLSRANIETRSVEKLGTEIEPALDRLVVPIVDPSERRALMAMRPEDGDTSEPAVAEDGDGFSPLLWAGVGTMATGALVGVATAICGVYLDGVVRDPSSSPDQRDQARTLGQPIVIGGVAAAGALVIAGAVLTVLGVGE